MGYFVNKSFEPEKEMKTFGKKKNKKKQKKQKQQPIEKTPSFLRFSTDFCDPHSQRL